MRKNDTIKNVAIASMIGGMGIAGCMYLKKNKGAREKLKLKARDLAKKTYEMLDDTTN